MNHAAVESLGMAKSTPHFNDMMAQRGGMGATAPPAAKPAPKMRPPKPGKKNC